MKNTLGYLLLLIFLSSCSIDNNSVIKESTSFKGSYLGQKKPGLQPEIFAPEILSTGLNEGACTFSPDGKELYFHLVYEKDHNLIVSIAGCKEINGEWNAPEFVNFSGLGYFDGYPFLSYDGQTLYFSSNRPTGDPFYTSKNNVWYSERNGDTWTEPNLLRLPTNGKDDVSGISISESGKYYYTLISEKEQAIYCTELVNGKFKPHEKLPETVNSGQYQFDGMISPDDSYMLLCAYGRDDSFGSTDLYITFKNEGNKWSELINLEEEFNTKEVDGPATITPDGKYIFFSGYVKSGNWQNEKLNYLDLLNYQQKPGCGNSDVYWVDAKIIEKIRKAKFNF